MTIAINAKIHEGVVLASDSATTMIDPSGRVFNVYEHANKIFNLYKGLPIGAITYGLGNIGHASIATLAKDFRQELKTKMDPENYKLIDIANQFSDFINGKYESIFKNVEVHKRPALGFVIGGYSTNSDLPEEYQIIFPFNVKPMAVRPPQETGLTWNGEVEPLTRLILGHGSQLDTFVSKTISLFKGQKEANQFVAFLKKSSQVSMITPGMPLQDVIYLAEYLVETAIKFAKFRPGAQTVGGPIEIAVISKHEGFKWVKRKHYFSTELNNFSATETQNLSNNGKS
ncbi:hypothetical protein [Flexithrix dorotheae]|uniref:hypothetical protein n=1 Tax=Flexithrix dorotheae TaxID=70993 RepID=UPI00037AD896|nr:hypothetical protein [Flexithrix dorotheae]